MGEGGSRLHDSGRLNQRPFCAGRFGMAAGWKRHRRQPVLHHALPATAPRRTLYGVRSCGERDGRGGPAGGGGISCAACESGTELLRNNSQLPTANYQNRGSWNWKLGVGTASAFSQPSFRALCFLRHLNPPLHVVCSRDVCHCIWRTLPPGTSGLMSVFSLRGSLPRIVDTRCRLACQRERGNQEL
jgi:hypothetical protein